MVSEVRYKKNQKIKIILLIGGIIIFAGGGFWLVMKFSKDKKSGDSNHSQQFNPQKKELETKLSEIKNQINNENNPEKKRKLEEIQKNLEQQISNLGGSNNPNNSPPQTPSNQNPTKTNRQLTVKCNGSIGTEYEFINNANYQERIWIDSRNQKFNSLSISKGDQYTISFNEEDATKKKGHFFFEENNDKFSLTSLTPAPPVPIPSPNGNQINTVCKYNGSVSNGYWLFTDQNKLNFNIAKNHSFLEKKKLDHSPTTPRFNIKFIETNASRQKDNHYFFDADNSNFELIPQGKWPDDPNWTLPSSSKSEVKVKAGGFHSKNCYIFNEYGKGAFGEEKVTTMYLVSINHPIVKKWTYKNGIIGENGEYLTGKNFIIKHSLVDGIEDNGYIICFNEFNKELEITAD